jgi:predicted PurR-regulated permease PerM
LKIAMSEAARDESGPSASPKPLSRDRAFRPEPAPGRPSQTRVIVEVLLIIVGVAFGLWALHAVASVILVLILAALFAYLMAPLVRMAERPMLIAGRRRHLPRVVAIFLVYAMVTGSVVASVVLLLPSATQQVEDMISRAPSYAQSVLTWERGWSRYYEKWRIPTELRRGIDQSVLAADAAALESANQSALVLAGALSKLPWLLLVPVLGFFLLKDVASFRRVIVIALPHETRLRGHRLFEELDATLAAYVRAQLLGCLLVGGLCGLGFAILGIPYPVPLGVLAGLLEFIPIVGPLLLALVASLVSALHDPMLVLWVIGFLGILRIVEDYVIYPRLIRRGLQLHPLAVIVAVLAGAELDGAVGMFLAVPAVAMASVACRHWLAWRRCDRLADATAAGVSD